MFSQLMKFIIGYSYGVWSCKYHKTVNQLFYEILLLKVIDIVLEEFSAFHSKFIMQPIDSILIDDDELIG